MKNLLERMDENALLKLNLAKVKFPITIGEVENDLKLNYYVSNLKFGTVFEMRSLNIIDEISYLSVRQLFSHE